MRVFVNGCFDIVHRGHLELLRYASSLAVPAMGGGVIVGINSDRSISRLKGQYYGPSRPINNQEDRKFLLESLKFVDEVHIFEEDTPRNLIEKIKPNLIIKGASSRWKDEETAGYEVAIFCQVGKYSSTGIINKLL